MVPKRARGAKATQTIQQRFDAYHAKHPEVWNFYLRFSYELLEAGVKHYGVAAITERIRWEFITRPDETEAFKISNDHRSRYARRLIEHEPRFADLFTTRPLRSA